MTALSPLRRTKILDDTIKEIHSRNTEMYQQTKDAVDSDIGKLRMEGAVPVDPDGTTSLDRARQVLQPKDFQTYLGKWNTAQQQFNVLSPIDDMTEEGYAKHMKDWSSGPASSINYNDATKIRETADKTWDGILTKRATDPGGAADAASEVAAYNQSVEKMPMAQRLDGSYGPAITPQQYMAGRVNARLTAQSRWDIAPDDQRIVSQAEAAKLLRLGENNRDVKQLDPVQFDSRMKAAARRAETLYGPEYATRALDESLKYLVNDDTMRQLGLATAASMLTGKAPAFSDVQALQLAHTISPMTALSNVLNILGVVLMAGSLSMTQIVASQNVPFLILQPLGFVIFFLGTVAEMNRSPFDLLEADSEIVAGYHIEYSGMKFAMFYLGEYGHTLAYSCIIATLFLGGWQGPFLPPIIWFLIKVVAVFSSYRYGCGLLFPDCV